MTSDLGFFGPDSVTWRLHADPVVFFVGGLRALLLQALHPRAIAGVAAHDGFTTDPWGRLQRTSEYLAVTAFGTVADAEQAAARVRRIHRSLTAVDPDTGRVFRLDEPDLLLWVHCAEVDSTLATARLAGVGPNARDADRYVAEQVRSAELVGVPVDMVPRTAGDLASYLADMRSTLRLTPAARSAARFVLVPPMPTWVVFGTPARPAWAGVAGLALGALPGWARRMYWLPGLPTTRFAVAAGLRVLRTTTALLPPKLREGPALTDARRRLAETPVRRLQVVPPA